jgi:hypothetical protein
MPITENHPDRDLQLLLPMLYFFGRILLFLGLIPNDLHGFGDFPTYFGWAGLKGWPFFDYWVEYPPIFPFLNAGIFKLASGQQFLYDFLLVLLISLAGAACIWAFQRIATRLYGERAGWIRTVIYFAVLAPLPYTWWYYEPLPLVCMLLGIDWAQRKEDLKAGVAIGLGILTKWFPIFLLPAIWRYLPRRRAWQVILLALGLTIVVVGGLYAVSPRMTGASLSSQPGRNSWQTVWALIDGNNNTGEYILLDERTDPAAARIVRGNPAKIPTLLTLAIFLGIGLWLFLRIRATDDRSMIAFIGITWAIFFLWSPGWSPQWILYLIPLILLTLPHEKGMFMVILLSLVTLFEWPFVLTHHLYAGMWLIVPARMALLVWLIVQWQAITRQERLAPLPQMGVSGPQGEIQ